MTQYTSLIRAASAQDREVLAAILRTRSAEADALVDKFLTKSRTLWERLRGENLSYEEVLERVGAAHGIRSVRLERTRDFERRIVRTISQRALDELPGSTRLRYLSGLKRMYGKEVVGAGSIVAAQASGFGVYQMATTVMGMASHAAGVTIPFVGYMALTKGISLLIGPLGWASLGLSTLHKLTKPNYEELVATVAWFFAIRSEYEPEWALGGYSFHEIIRKLFKVFLPCCVALVILVPKFANEYIGERAEAVQPAIDAPSLNPDITPTTGRAAALDREFGGTGLKWKSREDEAGNPELATDLEAKVLLDEVVGLDQHGQLRLVVTRSDEGGAENNQCHACQMMMSAFLFSVSGTTWELTSAKRNLGRWGSFGVQPEITLLHLSHGVSALALSDTFSAQGEVSARAEIFVPRGQTFRKIFEYTLPEHPEERNDCKVKLVVGEARLSPMKDVVVKVFDDEVAKCEYRTTAYECVSLSPKNNVTSE